MSPVHLAILSGRPSILRLLLASAGRREKGKEAAAAVAEALGQRTDMRFRGRAEYYSRDDQVRVCGKL